MGYNDYIEQQRRAQLLQEMKEKIKQYGWYAIGVFPCEGDVDPVPPFTYTVGLWKTFGHPELVVSGVDNRIAHAILTGIIDTHIKPPAAGGTGTGVDTGRAYDGVLQDGYQVAFRQLTVEQIKEKCGWGHVYYEGQEYPVFQCLLPDKERRFPWDEGFEDPEGAEQELLYITNKEDE
jgi:hypothetical protein